ncbi:Abi family protein [Curtobacterium sp. NPDC090223]|uniref:Abi family protein n=1 Tax=Curtobacterium sp. NPDC090223 TaxID=3363972 RepID=UPI00380E3FB3
MPLSPLTFVSCAVVAAGSPEIVRSRRLGALLPHSVALSAYRSAQFRRALSEHDHEVTEASLIRVREFDSCLRSLLLTQVERIELALRGRVDASASAEFGQRWHLDPAAFRRGTVLDALRQQYAAALDRSYDPAVRAIWRRRRLDQISFGMLSEELSFGTLSRVTGALDAGSRNAVAASFRLPPSTLRGTMQHVAHVRNCCAHHTRVWGRQFGVPTPQYRSPDDLVARLDGSPLRSPYRSIVVICHLADTVDANRSASRSFARLLRCHPDLLSGIGGPATSR